MKRDDALKTRISRQMSSDEVTRLEIVLEKMEEGSFAFGDDPENSPRSDTGTVLVFSKESSPKSDSAFPSSTPTSGFAKPGDIFQEIIAGGKNSKLARHEKPGSASNVSSKFANQYQDSKPVNLKKAVNIFTVIIGGKKPLPEEVPDDDKLLEEAFQKLFVTCEFT